MVDGGASAGEGCGVHQLVKDVECISWWRMQSVYQLAEKGAGGDGMGGGWRRLQVMAEVMAEMVVAEVEAEAGVERR